MAHNKNPTPCEEKADDFLAAFGDFESPEEMEKSMQQKSLYQLDEKETKIGSLHYTPKLYQSALPFSFSVNKPSKDFKKAHQKVKRQMAYQKKKRANMGQEKKWRGPKMSAGAKRLDAYLSKNYPNGMKEHKQKQKDKK